MRKLLIIIRAFAFIPARVLNMVLLYIAGVKQNNIKTHGVLNIVNSGGVVIGSGTKINSSKYKNIIGGDTRTSIIVHKGAKLRIGGNVRISNSTIQCSRSISIGSYTMIGGSCKIWDTDFHSIDPEIRKNTPNNGALSGPVEIGENVFVGGFSIILKGVKIGDNAVVASGSVVSKSIPPGEIWGGNPAKFIRKI